MVKHESLPFSTLHKGKFDAGTAANLPTEPEGVGDAYYATDTNVLYLTNLTGDAWIGHSLSSGGLVEAALQSPQALTGSAVSINLANIPASNYELVVALTLRSDVAATGDDIDIQINSDTGSNYWYHIKYFDTAASLNVSSPGSAQTQIRVPNGSVGASGTSGRFSSVRIHIPGYCQASIYKFASIECGIAPNDTNTDYRYTWGTGRWTSTSAITSIEIQPVNGTNFVTGSTYALFARGTAI